jgi:hypothetical protein
MDVLPQHEADHLLDPFQDTPLVDVPYNIYERLLIMWEAVEYASVVGYPEAIEIAQSNADTTLERSLMVGETKNMVLMRTVRYDLPLCPVC